VDDTHVTLILKRKYTCGISIQDDWRAGTQDSAKGNTSYGVVLAALTAILLSVEAKVCFTIRRAPHSLRLISNLLVKMVMCTSGTAKLSHSLRRFLVMATAALTRWRGIQGTNGCLQRVRMTIQFGYGRRLCRRLG
jgi:hypothetical protein